MNSDSFTFHLDEEGVGHLVFDRREQKVNTLSLSVLDELEKILDVISQNKEIKACLLTSGKGESFIAGADLHDFETIFQHPEKRVDFLLRAGHRVFNKIQNLPFPMVAWIQGVCLGGGLELALACHFRVVTDHPKTLLGLPEVTLGIMPGWGGTQRLPRLISLREAVSMIASGRAVNATKAYKIHLADAIYAWEFAKEKQKEFLKLLLSKKGKDALLQRRNKISFSDRLLQNNPLGRYVLFNQAKKEVLAKTKGHYPAPIAAIETIENTYRLPLKEGLEKEGQIFSENISNSFSYAPNLVQVFFQHEALKKDAGMPLKAEPEPIKSAGVLGAGTMGGGIAWLFSYQDIPVRIKDINWEALTKGAQHLQELYDSYLKNRKMKTDEICMKLSRVSETIDFTGFQQTNLVIEAVAENVDIKHQVFQELEKHISPEAVVATNTSSLTLKELSPVFKHPERFVGMHFFNPPNKMPLVEVVKGEHTSEKALSTAVAICRKLGKIPLIVKDCTGFLVNRIFVLGANECFHMLQENIPMERIEKQMLAFGMPMAPFILADEIGNDVSYKAVKMFEKAYGKRMAMPPLLEWIEKKHLYGKKTGKGFYVYQGKKHTPNPEVQQYLDSSPQDLNSASISDQEIVDRMIFSMINEASRCLEEQIVDKPSYLDMALILGLGFPPFRGGLLRYADSRGIDTIVGSLQKFKTKYGSRFEPSPLLLEMARGNKKFYA